MELVLQIKGVSFIKITTRWISHPQHFQHGVIRYMYGISLDLPNLCDGYNTCIRRNSCVQFVNFVVVRCDVVYEKLRETVQESMNFEMSIE